LGGNYKMKHTTNNFIKAGLPTQLIATLVAFILLFSAVPLLVAADGNYFEINQEIQFSIPVIDGTAEGNLYSVEMQGADAWVHTQRAPLLPRFSDVITVLPYGSYDINVDFTIESEIFTMELDEGSYVTPAPIPVPLRYPQEDHPILKTIERRFSDEPVSLGGSVNNPMGPVYEINAFYPDEVFKYDIHVGSINGENGVIITGEINPVKYNPVTGMLEYFTQVNVNVQYKPGEQLGPLDDEQYDLLIVTANDYVAELQPLVDHKEEFGWKTKLISLDEIYNEVYFEKSEEYSSDSQEEIKYFLYQAWKNWDVEYVMAVGGFRTFWGLDRPNMQFPIRYSHLDDGSEPGYACDQYYCCLEKYVGNQFKFDSWDTDGPTGGGDGIFAESTDDYDHFPEVTFGRIACRNKIEVRTMVDKIITYETKTYESDWFNQLLTITGDGFGDLPNLAIDWDVSSLPDGEYTIYAQSKLYYDQDFKGPIDSVTVSVDHTAESAITFHEIDHMLIEPLEEDQEGLYPGKPVATIVVPSPDDILGNTDVNFIPEEAYCSDYTGWGNVAYTNQIMQIKTKSYDPSPKDDINNFGSQTYVIVWVNNSDGETVFPAWGHDPGYTKYAETFYEGEMECQQAIDYMPDTFEKIKFWASNGQWTGMGDVIDKMSEGQGFIYFAGHGNPMSWGDHLPGIPGGRDDGMINGLKCINMDFGLARYESEEGDPLFPMDALKNGDKLSVLIVGGCHNSAIDASFMRLLADPEEVLFTVLHGLWVPETWSWWLNRVPQGGAIATVGCAGLGYGYLGESCLIGLGGWINPEFFRVYADEEGLYNHDNILGDIFRQTIENYAVYTNLFELSDRKTFEEWVFLGDPTMKIGGYEPDTGSTESLEEVDLEIGEFEIDGSRIRSSITNNGNEDLMAFDWELRFDSANYLGRYFGLLGTMFEGLLKGRVFKGGYTGETARGLYAEETMDIISSSVFGLGHVDVNVSVYIGDELVAYQSEDGFLVGNRIILEHPEE